MKQFLYIAISIILQCQFVYSFNNNSERKISVLFLGNSYVSFNDMPFIFKSIASESGRDVYVDSYSPSGQQLIDHVNDTKSLAKINERNWDFVVLVGSSVGVAYPETFTTLQVETTLKDLKKIISKNNPTTQMIFCLPWAYEDGMTWKKGWTDTYVEMQEIIYINTINYFKNIELWIAPVGWAWNKVLFEKKYPLHYLHSEDWNHPSLAGSYLATCVIFSTLFQESCSGNSYRGALFKEDAFYFQNIASKMVLDNLELWNIIKTTSLEYSSENRISILSQNFPNPARSITTINYELSETCSVEISIFDLRGKLIYTPVKSIHNQGKYDLNIDTGPLKEGVYYYILSAKEEQLCKKMIVIK